MIQIIKIAIVVVDIMLSLLLFFFLRAEESGGFSNFLSFLMAVFIMNAFLIFY